jgi:hypothetical protein
MSSAKTGPEHFEESVKEVFTALESEGCDKIATMLSALVSASYAHTAAVVMQVDAATDGRLHELDAWREVFPRPPLKECRSKEARRPACAERHTEDCAYADPPPEPKHELLPVGTRVLVSDLVYNEETRKPERMNPSAGRISGYAADRTKYRWQREWQPGSYSDYESFAFADNRVEVHPDGPECPPPPKPVKREPTGPRVYVENRHGEQGYIRAVKHDEGEGGLWLDVQFLRPGVQPVWKRADSMTIIAASQVERCPSGQTGDECGSGENQCELCLAAEDEEGDMIERSMGLRD